MGQTLNALFVSTCYITALVLCETVCVIWCSEESEQGYGTVNPTRCPNVSHFVQ